MANDQAIDYIMLTSELLRIIGDPDYSRRIYGIVYARYKHRQ